MHYVHNFLTIYEQEMMEILEPLFDATELMSGSKYPTQGDLRIILIGLIEHLGLQSAPRVNSQAKVAEQIKEKLEEYWPILRDSSILGSLLDPRTKLSAFQHSEHQSALRSLRRCFHQYSSNLEDGEKERPVSKRDFFKNLMMKSQTTITACPSEIDRYLALPEEVGETDPLAWWRLHEERFPTLAVAARDRLAIQSTSVACEATFSTAKNTISLVRNRIDGESARASLCLKSWITNLKLDCMKRLPV